MPPSPRKKKTGKRGRKSWAKGKAEEFLRAHEGKFWGDTSPAARHTLYDTATNLWFQNFGSDQPYQRTPPDSIVLSFEPEYDFLSQEHTPSEIKQWRDMRTVRVSSYISLKLNPPLSSCASLFTIVVEPGDSSCALDDRSDIWTLLSSILPTG